MTYSLLVREKKLNLKPMSEHAAVKDSKLELAQPVESLIKKPKSGAVRIFKELEEDLDLLFQKKLEK